MSHQGWSRGSLLGIAALWAVVSVLGGCASYVTPGPGADLNRVMGMTPEQMRQVTPISIQQRFDRLPASPMPAAIAVVRLQGPEYRSYTFDGYGDRTPVTIMGKRDAEKEEDFKRIASLPMVAGLAPINRMLVSGRTVNDEQLRLAAASLRADMLLIYTIQTNFYKKDHASPVAMVTLGLFPTRIAKVTSVASAILIDTRTGFIYSVLEASSTHDTLTNYWSSGAAVDSTRRKTEAEAFSSLVDQFEGVWKEIVARHAAHQYAVTQPTK